MVTFEQLTVKMSRIMVPYDCPPPNTVPFVDRRTQYVIETPMHIIDRTKLLADSVPLLALVNTPKKHNSNFGELRILISINEDLESFLENKSSITKEDATEVVNASKDAVVIFRYLLRVIKKAVETHPKERVLEILNILEKALLNTLKLVEVCTLISNLPSSGDQSMDDFVLDVTLRSLEEEFLRDELVRIANSEESTDDEDSPEYDAFYSLYSERIIKTERSAFTDEEFNKFFAKR